MVSFVHVRFSGVCSGGGTELPRRRLTRDGTALGLLRDEIWDGLLRWDRRAESRGRRKCAGDRFPGVRAAVHGPQTVRDRDEMFIGDGPRDTSSGGPSRPAALWGPVPNRVRRCGVGPRRRGRSGDQPDSPSELQFPGNRSRVGPQFGGVTVSDSDARCSRTSRSPPRGDRDRGGRRGPRSGPRTSQARSPGRGPQGAHRDVLVHRVLLIRDPTAVGLQLR